MISWNRALEAWGDVRYAQGDEDAAREAAGRARGCDSIIAAERRAQALLPKVLRPAAGAETSPGAVPTLRSLCLAFLGRHITELVAQVGPHLGPLPADIKACLLCVARRRGQLRNRVLLALADEGWTLMDLADATALSERAIRQALLRCPRLRALDLRGLPASAVSVGLLRQLPELCPQLELLALGGCGQQEDAALEVLRDILPHVRVPEQQQASDVQESWEEAVGDGGVALPDPGQPRGLQRLELLVWPHPPAVVHHTVRCVSPTVTVLEELPAQQRTDGAGSGGGGGGGTVDGGGGYCGGGPLCGSGGSGTAGTSAPGHRSGSSGGLAGRADSLPGCAPAEGPHGVGGPSRRADSAGVESRQAGIRVIHVGGAHGAGLSDSPSRRAGVASSTYPAASAAAAGTRGSGGGAGGAKYTAPHLRRQDGGGEEHQRQQGVGRDAQEYEANLDAQQGAGDGRQPPGQGPAPPQPHPHPHPQQRWQQQTPPQAGGSKGHQRSAPSTGPAPAAAQQQARAQLDDCLAALVAEQAWRRPPDGKQDEAVAFASLHIAEKFRLAYEQQDARLRAKARREAALEARREVRASGAARELARWLDEE